MRTGRAHHHTTSAEPILDHLVFGVADLATGVEQVEDLLGVRLAPGGRHPGWGTANRLLGLQLASGHGAYFEVIGPDPEGADAVETEQVAPLPFGLDGLTQPRLCTWAVRTTAIDALATASRAAGYDPGPVQAMRRRRPDGTELSWRLALPEDLRLRHGGLVPFLIDWGAENGATRAHPSVHLDAPLRLHRLRLEAPDPARVQADLQALGLETWHVTAGAEPRLVAELEGPRGLVELV